MEDGVEGERADQGGLVTCGVRVKMRVEMREKGG